MDKPQDGELEEMSCDDNDVRNTFLSAWAVGRSHDGFGFGRAATHA